MDDRRCMARRDFPEFTPDAGPLRPLPLCGRPVSAVRRDNAGTSRTGAEPYRRWRTKLGRSWKFLHSGTRRCTEYRDCGSKLPVSNTPRQSPPAGDVASNPGSLDEVGRALITPANSRFRFTPSRLGSGSASGYDSTVPCQYM